jgi:hypothetical protein
MDKARFRYINAGFGGSTGFGLRLMKLTLGVPATTGEANRMVTEKVIALGEVAAKVATGSTTRSVVKGYRKKAG